MINYKNLSRDTKGVVSELFYSKGFGGNFSRSFIRSVLGEDYIKDVINRATRAGIQMEFVNEIKKGDTKFNASNERLTRILSEAVNFIGNEYNSTNLDKCVDSANLLANIMLDNSDWSTKEFVSEILKFAAATINKEREWVIVVLEDVEDFREENRAVYLLASQKPTLQNGWQDWRISDKLKTKTDGETGFTIEIKHGLSNKSIDLLGRTSIDDFVKRIIYIQCVGRDSPQPVYLIRKI